MSHRRCRHCPSFFTLLLLSFSAAACPGQQHAWPSGLFLVIFFSFSLILFWPSLSCTRRDVDAASTQSTESSLDGLSRIVKTTYIENFQQSTLGAQSDMTRRFLCGCTFQRHLPALTHQSGIDSLHRNSNNSNNGLPLVAFVPKSQPSFGQTDPTSYTTGAKDIAASNIHGKHSMAVSD